MFISLQSYDHDVWAIQKEIKDAYPKKVCHMPTWHVKKKREKRKYSPYQKENIQRREKSYKGVPPSSTKNINTLAHLNQGL